MNKKREFGNSGEDYCVEQLIKAGYIILERNFRSPWGEIDIIAKDRHYLVFIEVKTRTKESIEHACSSITYSKQKKITKTAMYFLPNFADDEITEYRFDVMIVKKTNDSFEVYHMENAFPPAETGEFFM